MLARTRGGRNAVGARRRGGAPAGAPRPGGEVALATTADGLVEGPTTDRALIETALDRLAPAGGDGDAWPRSGDGDAVHFITDGAIARPIGTGRDRPFGLRAGGERRASPRSTSGRRSPAGNAGDAYLEVANFAPARAATCASRSRAARRRVFDRSVDMAAGEALRQVVPLARGAGAVAAGAGRRAGERARDRRRGVRVDRPGASRCR